MLIRSPTPKSRSVFQIQHPICSVNICSVDNRPIPQVKVNAREAEHNMNFEASQLLNSNVNLSRNL